jgi:DnaK suppressor protein
MLVYPETRIEDIRAALRDRHEELAAEHADTVAEMTVAGVADSGDDVADLGTKAFNREQEYALAVSIRNRMEQVERALERLADGHYGICEACGDEIPVARLAAFPSVTLCVGCKSRSESRH